MQGLLKYLKINKSKLLPIAILVFLVVATLITIIASQKRQQLKSKAANYTASLSFTPTALTAVPGQNLSSAVSVILNPGNQAVVGADILVNFDRTKLTLVSISKETDTIFKTFAPADSSGNFNSSQIVTTANNTGLVEFGIAAFDWTANTLTSPNPTHIVSPVTRLNFQAKSGATGSTTISFNYAGQGNTTDSNVVVNPGGTANPEDILAPPTSVVSITFSSTASPTPSATPRPTPSATPRPTPSATPRPTPSATPRPTPSATPRPTPTASPFATPTTPPTSSSLAVKIKFEGVFSQMANKLVKITLKSGTTTVYSQNITMSSDGTGIYSNQANYITGLTPGIYDIFIKGPVHLTRKFAGQTLAQGNNLLTFTTDNEMLLAGDSAANDKVDIFDYTDLVTNYKCNNAAAATPPPGKTCGSYNSDLDFNGIINIFDYNYMIGNFDQSGNQ